MQNVNFEKPPLTEVVFGAYFKPLEKLLAPHFGLFWNEYLRAFPKIEELPPVQGPRATPKLGVPVFQASFATLLSKPPLPRIRFSNPEGDSLLQIQRDAFFYNWNGQRSKAEYPRYKSIAPKFYEHFGDFRGFLRDSDLGEIKSALIELKYVNHIFDVDTSSEEMRKLLPDFEWRSAKRFLPQPAGFNYGCKFDLPEKRGALHLSARTGLMPDKREVIVMDLSARCGTQGVAVEEFPAWFDLAHEWIVNAFADLTSKEMQSKVWLKT